MSVSRVLILLAIMVCSIAPVVAEELCPNSRCPYRPRWTPRTTSFGSIREHLAVEHHLVLPSSISEQRCARIHDTIHDRIGSDPRPDAWQIDVTSFRDRDIVKVRRRR